MVYGNIEENEDVVNVLFMVICEYGNVKSMTGYLREKQSTISMKLQFLRKEGLVVKKKWNYEPKWNNIIKLFRNLLLHSTNQYAGWKYGFINIKKSDFKDLERFFPDSFIRRFLENYALQYFCFGVLQGLKPPSLEKLSDDTVLHLWLLKPAELKKVNPKFAELKRGIAEFENEILDAFGCMTDEGRRASYKCDLDKIMMRSGKKFQKSAKSRITANKGRQ